MVSNGTTTTYTYDNANRLLCASGTGLPTTYTYDNAGNLLTKSLGPTVSVQYSYNPANQLIGVQAAGAGTSYTYFPNGLRKSSTTQNGTSTVLSTTHYVWNGNYLILEKEGTNTTRYLYGLDLFASHNGLTANINYYCYDAHGSVNLLSNVNGAVTQEYVYDAFGNQLNTSTTDTNPFRYCGEYYDTETGNYYLRARYYDPGVGRFTQQDTYRGEITNPHSLNYYTYCYNDPVKYADESGNVPVDTVLDFVSLTSSVIDFMQNPSLANLAFVAWDAAALLLPYVPGSYVDDVVRAGARLIANANDYKKAGVWLLSPFERGWAIEEMLGGLCTNFKTIDNYRVLTRGSTNIIDGIESIKSIDLSVSTYQTASRLRSKIRKYIDDLANFYGTTYGKLSYQVAENTTRTLHIAVPPIAMTDTQSAVFSEMVKYAKEQGVTLIISIVE